MKRRIIVVTLLALVAALAVIVFVAFNQAARRMAIIGGLKVTFLDVLPEGKEFTTEKLWHRWARKVLPDRYQDWVPDSTTDPGWIAGNSIAVYLEVSSMNGAKEIDLPWNNYRTVSVDGEVFGSSGSHSIFGRSASGLTELVGIPLRSFPRRDPEFVLKFTKDDGTEVGSIRIPNPIRGSFPDWKPQVLPQTVTNGDMTVTLTTLAEVRTADSQDDDFLPTYELKSSNPLWSGTRVTETTYGDATGNEGFPLSRREPAWRAKATVHRTEAMQMRADEMLVLTNITAPTTNDHVPFPSNSSYSTSGLQLIAVSSRSVARPIVVFRPSGPWLIVDTKMGVMTNGDALYSHAFDDEGRDLGPSTILLYSPSRVGQGTHAISFDNWTNGTISRLELFISRPKTFEFFINPADVKTNGPSK